MPETEASLEEEEKRSFIKCAKCKRQARKGRHNMIVFDWLLEKHWRYVRSLWIKYNISAQDLANSFCIVLLYVLLDCTQSVCLKCCDDDGCEVHKEQREQALFREEVFAGTSLLQLQAKDKRSKLVAKGRFREPGFCYMGDTVVIW